MDYTPTPSLSPGDAYKIIDLQREEVPVQKRETILRYSARVLSVCVYSDRTNISKTLRR
jgi:hypothetical protein